MKQLLIILLLSVSIFGAKVDDLAKEMGFERDYKTALSKAKKAKKPLMMVLGADYCPWCRKFESHTLNSELIKPRIDSEVITLIVDKKFDIETFPKNFRTEITPKVFFINPKDESILLQSVGYKKKKEYAKILDSVKELSK